MATGISPRVEDLAHELFQVVTQICLSTLRGRRRAGDLKVAVEKLGAQIAAFDRAYKTEEKRICLNLSGAKLDETPTGSLEDLAAWAEARVEEAGYA